MSDVIGVSFILTSFNQAPYILEAYHSILNQREIKSQIILINNGSTDDSKKIMEKIQLENPEVIFLNFTHNHGLNKVFNFALALCSYDYVTDVAADDVLLPNKSIEQLNLLINSKAALAFSDVYITDENLQPLHCFYDHKDFPLSPFLPKVIKSFCIPSVSILFNKKKLLNIGGYNNALHYEDYDILIRMAEVYDFVGIQKPLVYYRKLPQSASSLFKANGHNLFLMDTLKVHQYILNKYSDKTILSALRYSIKYHFKQTLLLNDAITSKVYFDMIVYNNKISLFFKIYSLFLYYLPWKLIRKFLKLVQNNQKY